MLDTKGPEIRTGMLENGKNVELVKDQILEISKYLINYLKKSNFHKYQINSIIFENFSNKFQKNSKLNFFKSIQINFI